MSGLEAVGTAASILQIADVGMKVSINLCQLYSKVRRADSNLQTLSSEIALTCNVLHQLGELLKQDAQGSLCSQQALATAQDVLGECRRVFGEIENATERCKQNADDERDKERFLGKTFRRMTFVFKEPDFEALRKNLDRLKSTMLLMLNVIMYAGQVRSNTDFFMLYEQRDLIVSLIETKAASEAKVKVLSGIINNSKSAATAATTEVIPRDLGDSPSSCSSDDSLSFKSSLSYEMWIYCGLIREMLSQVDGCESELEENRYERIRERVWRLHMREAKRFPEEIPEEIQQVFGDIFPQDRDLEEKFTLEKARPESPNPKQRVLYRENRYDFREMGRPLSNIRLVSETQNLVLQWTTLDKDELEDSISLRRLQGFRPSRNRRSRSRGPNRSEESD